VLKGAAKDLAFAMRVGAMVTEARAAGPGAAGQGVVRVDGTASAGRDARDDGGRSGTGAVDFFFVMIQAHVHGSFK
jgi:hypothetical protein